MPISRRANTGNYQIFIRIKGRTIRRSSGTSDRQEALKLEAQLRAQLWKEINSQEKPPRSWQEAVLRYAEEKQSKRSFEDDLYILRVLDPYLSNATLQTLTRARIDEIVRELQRDRGFSDSRANRYLALIRGTLNLAYRDWEWLDTPVAVRTRKIAVKEPQWLTPEQADALIAAAPPHWVGPICFTLATGLRRGNVVGSTGLQWRHIDLDNRIAYIPASNAKAGKTLRVPLNRDAMGVLFSVKDGEYSSPTHVFARRGKPFIPDNKHWQKLLAKAGLDPSLRWHDLRHTWASWHARAGTSPQVLQQLGGWANLAMVERYAHLAPDHLAQEAERISTQKIHSGDF